MRRAHRARSYEGMEHPANPSAAPEELARIGRAPPGSYIVTRSVNDNDCRFVIGGREGPQAARGDINCRKSS